MTVPSVRTGTGAFVKREPVTGAGGFVSTHTIAAPAVVANGDAVFFGLSHASGTTYAYYDETASALKGLVLLYEYQVSGHSGYIYAKQNAVVGDASLDAVFKTRASSDPASSATTARVTILAWTVANAAKVGSLVNATQVARAVTGANFTVGTATPSVTDGLELQVLFASGSQITSFTAPGGITKLSEAIDPGTSGLGFVAIGTAAGGTVSGTPVGGDVWTNSAAIGSNWEGRVLVIAPVAAVASLRPDRIVSNAGSWTALNAATINAGLADEDVTTGGQSPAAPSAAAVRIGFGGAELSNANGDHVRIRVTDAKDDNSQTITRTYKLLAGSTTVKTFTAVTLSTTPTDRELTTEGDSGAATILAGVSDRSTFVLEASDTAS